jgi:hypothetical protein
MKKAGKSWKTFLALVVVALAAGLLWYVNRTDCEASDYWGQVCYGFRWGFAVELTIDRDQDGQPEVRARYDGGRPGYDPRYTHSVPEEVWEDNDGDGSFELHQIWQQGKVNKVQLDTDGDGTYDRELLGTEAVEYLKAHPWPGA